MLRRLACCLLAMLLMTSESMVFAQQDQLERINGKPNLNGIWQAINTAHWNLEAHPAQKIDKLWNLGVFGAIPAGQSVIVEGSIPYLPGARARQEENALNWPQGDPVTSCYLPGIPRATYMPFPFQIIQTGHDILMVYEYASTNRKIHMSDHIAPPVDTWMGRSNGAWSGDILLVETTGFNGKTWLDRSGNHHSPAMKVTERFTLIDANHIDYQATIEDPGTFTGPWTIRMPLYRRLDTNVQILEFRCVPFVEEMLYKDLELSGE